jgi:hypothetical protein
MLSSPLPPSFDLSLFIKTQNDQVGAYITKTLKCLGKSLSICTKKKIYIYSYIEIMFLSFKEKTKNLDFGGNSVFSMTH